MCDVLIIRPSKLRTGAPITAIAHVEEGSSKSIHLEVKPEGQLGLEPFQVPTELENDHLQAQFTVSFPGTYNLTLGKHSRRIEVSPQIDLTFRTEFGLFFIAVALIVGGMILWLRKKGMVGSA